MWASSFPPRGWMYCEGQELAIAEFDVLFSVIGSTYGGDNETTFRLPDLRGRAAVGAGTGPDLTPRPLGQAAGIEQVTLTEPQLPKHHHLLIGTTQAGATPSPAGALPAANETLKPYADSADTQMAAAMLGSAGEDQPHENMQPSLALRYIICVVGWYPASS